MNQRPHYLEFLKAISGFLQYKLAEGLSPNTVYGYDRDLTRCLENMGDMDIGKITSVHLLEYLNYLRTDYAPLRVIGGYDRPLSDKTVYNIYVSISAFFTWACREFEIANPMKKVPRPRVAEDPPVEPFKREDVEALLKACDFCVEAKTQDRQEFIINCGNASIDFIGLGYNSPQV